MYPGLSHDEIIEECLKELKHHFEVGPEVALISAEKGVQCVPFDESLQKKFPYFEGTYEVFDVPHTDFQIRYQPEQILAASGRKFVKDFLIYEAGALCGFFIAALMNAARAGQEITIKFEEDKHGTGKEHPDGAGDRTGTVPEAGRDRS